MRFSKGAFLILAFVLVVAGGGLLLYYLSKNPVSTANAPLSQEAGTETFEPQAVPSESVSSSVETVSPGQLAAAKASAEERLGDFVLAKQKLDRKGASQWGGDLYADMMQLSREGDELFMQKEYASASSKYLEASAQALRLESQTEEALHRLMEEASLALATGDSVHAQESFRLALMIDPANESAQHGLERATNLETVMGLLESGRRHETENNLAFALADYQEAVQLDPESGEAQNSLRRVKALIAEEQFQLHMSSGLTAFHQGDYQRARAELLEARSFRPDSGEVRDALAQVDQANRLAQIQGLRRDALLAEQSENWTEALEMYLAVLKIDPTIGFAIQGKDSATEQIRLAKRIDFYLATPEVLESERRLEQAILLIQQAQKIEPKGVRLRTQLKELECLVTVARTPVRVILESDNLTDVAVYKVGKLGRFAVRELHLRPGAYTVVGARNGFQDTRQEIVVKPGQESLRVAVVCKVKI